MGQFASSEGARGGPRSVLITGCSDGGLGAALAMAFHSAGLHVYATARDISKMKNLAASGIETLELDVTSPSSIASCVGKLPSLDILVNNAAAMLTMTAADVSIEEAKKVFDTNLWGAVQMCQAFLPLIIESKGIIVNHTSIASVLPVPGGAAYAASKAAMSMYSAILRMEVESFDVQVIDLKTGTVGPTNLINNNYTRTAKHADDSVLPEGSCYQPAKHLLEPILRQDKFKGTGMRPAEWAKAVVGDLLNNTRPPPLIFRGHYVILAKVAAWLPFGALDGLVKKTTKFDQVDAVLRQVAQRT
ncbi:short chain dehydrogenase [Colletotrichum graminicola]|uniref:Short chain dehydrogenase n=1 Tax=Colletotrichum graminicola (strain M1.001 / M2 / FGSC 10212) TaxID=645133 RepID=E3QX15_COLGM|nr:short chain dehydrogenase [Colletotrichum graminicola M1.001]EFQ35403.1 short chain dehydrogenase [Colletotrichum graminicola M1.001]WDK14949.1 short chain dehydrogenase [Colletotrichum graminicola]